MKIALTGGTGFVGKALTGELLKEGHEIVILTRNVEEKTNKENIKYVQWLNNDDHPETELQGTQIIINLAGESLGGRRWTVEQKQRIFNSRMEANGEVLNMINKLEQKPLALINASAVGFYGVSESKTFTEKETKPGNDFLAQTVEQWEETVAQAGEQYGVRTVFCRFGLILDKHEGAFPRMVLPYRLFAGGTIGSGRQWVSWIHIRDAVRAIVFAINHDRLEGPINFTAPYPVTMKEFGKTISSVIKRPHWMPVPAFALKLLLGEMSTLVLEGQKVLPVKLEANGFSFKYPTLPEALTDILQ
ncbi:MULTISPECIES: TIGR01777 family oxidoreductase [Bacillus]|uniref:TIGR01777 family oxidoreductase n=1 Tax=Bacillus TaxID=1386 RepID=UPI000C7854E2|nr:MULTISPECIES: TIGR01777 family oxidoreductase [Bacillus]PLR86914.1 TIGR01777 family protein [Bacillus sp. V33-4]RSK53287.1 TIGR01777 family protein [Bacillus canaveralius]